MTMIHAWLMIEAEGRGEYFRDLDERLEELLSEGGEERADDRRLLEAELARRSNEAPQTMISGETIAEVVQRANAVLDVLGVPIDGPRFDRDHYTARPGELVLGGGIVARLFACQGNGVNYTEAREPSAASLGL